MVKLQERLRSDKTPCWMRFLWKHLGQVCKVFGANYAIIWMCMPMCAGHIVPKVGNQQCILRVSVKHSFDGNVTYFVTLEIQCVTFRSPGSQNTFLSTQLQCAEGKQSYNAICYKVWNKKEKIFGIWCWEQSQKKNRH